MVPPSPSTIRIVLADDNRDFLGALAAFLDSHTGLRVIGSAMSGRDAVDMAVDLQPDVVLVDFDMPGMNGFETVRQIKTLAPAVRVVVVTGYGEGEYSHSAAAAGADGFVVKDSIQDHLLRTLDALVSCK